MADIQCQLEIPKEKGEDAVSLTVGRSFFLNCEGPWPAMKPDGVELRLDQENQDKLKLLKFTFQSPTEAQLTVTSYKVGQHQLKSVQVVDVDHSVVLGDLSFAVNSVINPQEPPKEPYGAFGPLSLRLSSWYVIGLILILVLLLGAFLYRWRQQRQKRKLLDEMRLNDYAQDPFFQFYQSARRMQRGYGFFSGAAMLPGEGVGFVRELNEAYKIYLARKLQVPTLAWSERRILSDLKKNWPDFYAEFRLEIRKSLAELSRATKVGAAITEKDCQQLFDLLRREIDQMDKWLKAKGSGS